jgi:3-oxoadipate enol-lactonase
LTSSHDIAALLDALSLTAPVHVVGSALGAGIAAAFAARHPARVARLVVQSLVTRANPATRESMLARAAQVEREGMRANVQASLDRSYPEILRGNRARFETYRARWLTNDPRGYAAINRMLQDMNIEPELANISAPTLLIGCQHDVLRPLVLERELVKLIPNVRYVEADSGHFMHAQSPELFAQLALPFLLNRYNNVSI